MNEEIRRKIFYFGAFAGVLAALTAGAYHLTGRFLADRQRAVARLSLPERRTPWKTEGMTRKVANGKFPQPVIPPTAPAYGSSGEAAIQRQLKTLEEINRLNEMNRQLMDQQRRAQNQR